MWCVGALWISCTVLVCLLPLRGEVSTVITDILILNTSILLLLKKYRPRQQLRSQLGHHISLIVMSTLAMSSSAQLGVVHKVELRVAFLDGHQKYAVASSYFETIVSLKVSPTNLLLHVAYCCIPATVAFCVVLAAENGSILNAPPNMYRVCS